MGKVLRRGGGESPLIARCQITESSAERMQGLLGRDSLAADEALWFPHCTSIHTFFMRFPIDVAFLDRGGRVIALYHALSPWRHTWIHLFALGGGTLEASAGIFAKAGLKKGEELLICPTA
jgi:uncharacterized membrane protein (UPF0127 family)